MEPTASLVTVPLGQSAHQLAEEFLSKQPKQKAKQVYLNTLAVYAVRFYLECIGINTNWECSDSHDPVTQILMDVADLEIHGLGKLECRPVLPGADSVQIPQEVWDDRIGYVAVQIDESLTLATLLGFVEMVSTKTIPIKQLRSLEELLQHLEKISKPEPVKLRANLRLWLQNQDIFSEGWQSLETLLDTEGERLVISSRSQLDSVTRAKLINLGMQLENQPLVLLVAIAQQEPKRMAILVRVRPRDNGCLPYSIRLALLLESGEILKEVQSGSLDNWIQLSFSGEPGECFDIQVAYGEASITESFLI